MKSNDNSGVRASSRKSGDLRFNLLWIAVAVIVTAAAFLYPPLREALGIDDIFTGGSDSRLAVHYIDVGQGDSSLIVAPDGTAMLIDAGPGSSETALSEYLKAQGVAELQYVVFTHPHEDHIGGGDLIMKNFKVGTVIMTDATATTACYEKLIDAISDSGAKVINAGDSLGKSFTLGSDGSAPPSFTLLAPQSTEYDSLNDTSVVLRLDYGGASFLFTGDAEATSESAQLAMFPDSMFKCTVLKVGHHGSSSSTSDAYLAAASPDYAVISCAKVNDYGHPHRETLAKLADAGITVYGTYDSGTIVFRTDGASVAVETQK